MSSGVAPVSSTSAAHVADRQPRRDPPHEDNREGNATSPPAPAEATNVPETGNVVTLNVEPATTNASAAFAASQLAERLRLVEANLRLLRLKSEGWKPPVSDLNLRDKTI